MPAVGAALLAVCLAATADAGPRRDQAYYHYLLSRQALTDRDLPTALREMDAARQADPASADLAVELARLHMEVGDPVKAAEAAREATELEPLSSEAPRLLAEALFTLAMRDEATPADVDVAVAALKDLQARAPGDAEVPLDLARLLASRGRFEEALAPANTHLEKNPGSEEGALLASQVLVKLGRFQQAQDLLLESIRVNPKRTRLRMGLMECYEAEGRFEDASTVATRLIEGGVEVPRIRYALARVRQKMGDYGGAYEQLAALSGWMDEHAAQIPPGERKEIELRKVGLLLEAGRLPDAATAAEQMALQHPDEERFTTARAEALILQGKQDEAARMFTPPGPEADARLSRAYLSAGARRQRQDDTRRAEQFLRTAIDLDPGNADALNHLGYMLADQGRRLNEAVDLVERALRKEPDNGAYLDSLGWAHYKKKEYRRSREILERARDAMPDEPEIHEHLGELYFSMGRVDEAIASWEKALQLGTPRAEQVRNRLSEARKGAKSGE
ncbi:MAG: tetratricopeptide repeat protein [Candidatus Polarisedimenticolia bacterium]